MVMVSLPNTGQAESPNRSLIDYDPTAHAEVSAIRKACKELKTIDLTGCHIYTSCYPCRMCMAAIYWARLEAIFYAVSMEEYSQAANFNIWTKMMTEDEVKPNEERTIYREWVSSYAEAAKKVGEEWLLKKEKAEKA
ncbi:uncharacterized protein LOC116287488 isoform X2 [Actinia tenebrosa]|uniref:Uncharacterized protein LOC116287488 isoform X2 n=1 Tax=Actinia tenebrosa TaxID=6105 RepID=A0A6P8H340_ACTTE|nr:uncharacterized protein LOC116287488 isoform X2 [Actinia tenebrosa]